MQFEKIPSKRIVQGGIIGAVAFAMTLGTQVCPATIGCLTTVYAATSDSTYAVSTGSDKIVAVSSFESAPEEQTQSENDDTQIFTEACMSSATGVIAEDDSVSEETPGVTVTETPQSENNQTSQYSTSVLDAYHGTCSGPSGKETYYNLPMDKVISMMRARGYSEEEYPYWIRDDGMKMFGPYIMVAADLNIRPKGTILECSRGTAIVVDTGDFAHTNHTQLDVATIWE